MIHLPHPSFDIQLVDEDHISIDASTYGRREELSEKPYRPVSHVGVRVQHAEASFSVLVSATGGATAVHAHSAVALEDQLLLGVCGNEAPDDIARF